MLNSHVDNLSDALSVRLKNIAVMRLDAIIQQLTS